VEAEIIDGLTEVLEELGQKISDNTLVNMLESHVNTLARAVSDANTEEALEKAIEVSSRAQGVLEHLKDIVSEAAIEYIELAENAVKEHVQILEDCLQRWKGGLVTSITEALEIYEETLEDYQSEYTETYEDMAKQFGLGGKYY